MQLVQCTHGSRAWVRASLTVLFLLAFVGVTDDAQAQWVPKWLDVGDFQHRYQSGGAETEADQIGWHYPGIYPNATYSRWKGFWISAENVMDETGRVWPLRISHIGPRLTGVGEMFDISHTLYGKFEDPPVTVDGFESFSEPVVVDVVDPALAPDRMVETVINSSIGVTTTKRAMQWSHPDHEDYHIIEYTFTNTGNVDFDDEIEVDSHTLENVFFTILDRPTTNAQSGAWDNSAGGVGWGQYNMNDAVGDGLSDYGVDFRAQFTWIGQIPGARDWNTIGNPMGNNHQWNAIADDTLGRLGGANFSGSLTIHADDIAHAPGEVRPDDRTQPHTMTYQNTDWTATTSIQDHTNEANMAIERDFILCGSSTFPSGAVDDACQSPRTWPTHSRLIMGNNVDTPRDEPVNFATQDADPTRGGGAGGWGYMTSFGPYTMAPGEEVKIVMAEGVTGLSQEAAFAIGREYRKSGWDDDLIIEYDADGNGTIDVDEAMTKNDWVMTARDSLFQMFQRATDNYNGGLNAPHPPQPPTSFSVTSGTDQIDLEWAGSAPAGWEIWRAQKSFSGIVTALSVGPDGFAVEDVSRSYQLVASLSPNETSFSDTDVVRGGSYYYYLQAVDANGLKSSRYYAQTYDAAFLKRPPGNSLEEVRIVPNPFHLGSEPNLRLDVQDRMAFYGIPGQSRIEIYTEFGELIKTLEHTDGSGDEFWDMTTSSRQVVASGLYLAVVTDTQTGEQRILKFLVIR